MEALFWWGLLGALGGAVCGPRFFRRVDRIPRAWWERAERGSLLVGFLVFCLIWSAGPLSAVGPKGWLVFLALAAAAGTVAGPALLRASLRVSPRCWARWEGWLGTLLLPLLGLWMVLHLGPGVWRFVVERELTAPLLWAVLLLGFTRSARWRKWEQAGHWAWGFFAFFLVWWLVIFLLGH